MSFSTSQKTQISLPTSDETAWAKETSRKLAIASEKQEKIGLQLGNNPEIIEFTPTALRLVKDVLLEMAKGNAVTLIPVQGELTTQQAADLLNVSRTHLVQLLDRGEIKHRKVGSHRRVKVEDILAYRDQTQVKRREVLDELTAYDQELGLQ